MTVPVGGESPRIPESLRILKSDKQEEMNQSGCTMPTLFKFHQALVKRKYSRPFSPAHKKRMPGPKGPSQKLIDAIVEMKRRNPRFGCPRIAQQINKAFGYEIDKAIAGMGSPKYLSRDKPPDPISLDNHKWNIRCGGLFQLPVAV